MPHMRKRPFRTPFGVRVFLRSTQDVKTESYTVAAESVPWISIDGHLQKVLHKGVVMAKITSGEDAGKIGPFQAAGTSEVTTLTSTGAPTGGDFTITALGVTTDPIAYNASAAMVADAVNAALEAGEVDGSVVGAGGPLGTDAVTLTWVGAAGNIDQPTVNDDGLTGGTTPAITPTTSTAGVSGATDGRGVLTNIVGINNTFLPYQLEESDREIAIVYEAAVVQDNCRELNEDGAEIVLTDTTAAAMFAKKSLNISFH